MIKFEHNMLVLNSSFSEDDVDQIDAFADHVRSKERERIVALLNKLRDSEYAEIMTHEDLVEIVMGKK